MLCFDCHLSCKCRDLWACALPGTPTHFGGAHLNADLLLDDVFAQEQHTLQHCQLEALEVTIEIQHQNQAILQAFGIVQE